MKKKILVEGPILTQSGYGEHARFVLRSLRSREDAFDIYTIPLNWGQTSWIFEDNEERQWFDHLINKTVNYVNQGNNFDIYVHVGIPPELKRKAPITISVNASIETDRVQAEWIDALNKCCDKIITISEHSKNVLTKTKYKAQEQQTGKVFDLKLNVPVDIVGYPVKNFKKLDNFEETLKLDYDFNFLCVAQWGPRKNLENTIRWFLEEFKNDKVGLVCKVNGANNSSLDKEFCNHKIEEILKTFPNKKCKIYLLHGDMSEDEIHNLYMHSSIKAIINFGHGEGFGLPLFEAAYCGLPVITHDFGGQKDFLYINDNGKEKAMFSKVSYTMSKIQNEAIWTCCTNAEMEWAYVKPFSAKSSMRECYKNWNTNKERAKNLQDYIINNMEETKVYNKFNDCILNTSVNFVL